MRHDPARRGFVRLLDTPEVEAWLLTWTHTQSIELHDHGGSAGAAMVVAGELTESFTNRVSNAPLRQNVWERGSSHFFDASHIHDLQNRGCRGRDQHPRVFAAADLDDVLTITGPTSFLTPLRVERSSRRRFTRTARAPDGAAHAENDRSASVRGSLAPGAREAAALPHALQEDGALFVDIRPAAQRRAEGEIPGALIVERNVLEWRLDPASPHRMPRDAATIR